ncbi:MAG TPA: protein translocase subunit SecF [Candidatus Eisenbacteria bacterium]|nr:protein translocase subunit SecF [Candidatus Eisenbacteria bacterium]
MTLPIIKLRNVWFMVSSALVIASIAILVMYPLRFGIDFTGGSLMEVEFKGDRPAPAEVGAAVSELGLGESVAQTVGDKEMLLRLKTLDEPTHQKVVKALDEKFGGVIEHRFESVGPTVGDELRKKAAWSITLVLIGIALYVSYAFRKVSRPVASWKYGIVTLIIGIMHDVLLPVAAFALLGHFTLAEANSSFVAAILTVLGFSVHDTIVVFDRIRENLLRTGGAFEEIVERSVNETLSRSINTSLTATLPLIAIYIWGGESLKYFAFTLIIGLIAGTYSSIFLASPLLVVMQKKSSR